MKPEILFLLLAFSSCSLFFGQTDSEKDPLAQDRNNAKFIQISSRSDSGIITVNGKPYPSNPQSFTTTHTLDAVGLVKFLILFTPSVEYEFDSFNLTSGGVSRRIYTNPLSIEVENSSVYLEVNLKTLVQDPPGEGAPSIAYLQAIQGNDKLYVRSWNTNSAGYLYNPTDGSFLPGGIKDGVADISGKIVSFGRTTSAVVADVWNDPFGAYSLYTPTGEQRISFPWVDTQGLNFLTQESTPAGRSLELKTWNWSTSILSTKALDFYSGEPVGLNFLDLSYSKNLPLDTETVFVESNVGIFILKKSQGKFLDLRNHLLWGLSLLGVDKVNRKCLAYRSGEYDGTAPAWYWIDAQGYETRELSLESGERLILSEGSSWNILKNENEIWTWLPGTGERSLQKVLNFRVTDMVSSGDGSLLYLRAEGEDRAFYSYNKQTKELKRIPVFE